MSSEQINQVEYEKMQKLIAVLGGKRAAPEHTKLVRRVTGMCKGDPQWSSGWDVYCDLVGGGLKDPSQHTEQFLAQALDQVDELVHACHDDGRPDASAPAPAPASAVQPPPLQPLPLMNAPPLLNPAYGGGKKGGGKGGYGEPYWGDRGGAYFAAAGSYASDGRFNLAESVGYNRVGRQAGAGREAPQQYLSLEAQKEKDEAAEVSKIGIPLFAVSAWCSELDLDSEIERRMLKLHKDCQVRIKSSIETGRHPNIEFAVRRMIGEAETGRGLFATLDPTRPEKKKKREKSRTVNYGVGLAEKTEVAQCRKGHRLGSIFKATEIPDTMTAHGGVHCEVCDTSDLQVQVPHEHAGKVIGTGGSNLKKMQRKVLGAVFRVPRREDPPGTPIVILGLPLHLHEAEQEIQEVVTQCIEAQKAKEAADALQLQAPAPPAPAAAAAALPPSAAAAAAGAPAAATTVPDPSQQGAATSLPTQTELEAAAVVAAAVAAAPAPDEGVDPPGAGAGAPLPLPPSGADGDSPTSTPKDVAMVAPATPPSLMAVLMPLKAKVTIEGLAKAVELNGQVGTIEGYGEPGTQTEGRIRVQMDNPAFGTRMLKRVHLCIVQDDMEEMILP